jgi:hypothetical protein
VVDIRGAVPLQVHLERLRLGRIQSAGALQTVEVKSGTRGVVLLKKVAAAARAAFEPDHTLSSRYRESEANP